MDTSLDLINNSGYGAPELKETYQSSTLRSFIIALAIHLIVIIAYLLISYINKVNAKEIPYNPIEPPIIVDVNTTENHFRLSLN